MRSDRFFILSGALALGLVISGCSKKQDTAATPAAESANQATAPAESSPATQPPTPAAPQPQMDETANSHLQDLQLQVDAYEKIYKRKPDSLDQMLREGFMNSLPAAPAGKRFDYDSATARVSLVSQ